MSSGKCYKKLRRGVKNILSLSLSLSVSVLESQKFDVTPIEAVKVRDEKENINVSQFQISNEKPQKPPKITKDLMVFLLVFLKLCLAYVIGSI